MTLKALNFYAVVLICLVLFSFASEAKAQTDSIVIDIPDNITAPTGTQISVPVNYTYNTTGTGNIPTDGRRIVSFNFAVNYNQNVLSPTGVDGNGDPAVIDQNGTLTQTGFSCSGDAGTAGRLGVSCATGGNGIAARTGTLINLLFVVVGQPNSGTCCTALNFSQAAGEAPRFQRFDSGPPTNSPPVPTTATGGSFFVQGTTAASVNLSGRVLTAQGRGLRGAQVRLTLADGTTRTVISSAFGHYRFTDLQAGQTVTIQVISKKYGYQSHTVNLTGDATGVDFVAER